MMKLFDAIAGRLGIKRGLVIAIVVALVVVAAGVAKCSYDRSVVDDYVAGANNRTLGKVITANDVAAGEDMTDAATIAEKKKGFDDAIHNPLPGDHVDPRIRHACQQLRAQGSREADLPASCRRAGAGGEQAAR